MISPFCKKAADTALNMFTTKNKTGENVVSPWLIGTIGVAATGGTIYATVHYTSKLRRRIRNLDIEIATLNHRINEAGDAPHRLKEYRKELADLQQEHDQLQRLHNRVLTELEDAKQARMDARDQLLALSGAFAKEYNANQAFNAESLLQEIEADRRARNP